METFKNEEVLSKHFIYQKHLIFSSKRLLTVSKKAIIIDSLPFQYDQREYISFEDLTSIRFPPKKSSSPRDFSLITEKKSNASLHSYITYDPQPLISSLHMAVDSYHYENEQIQPTADVFIGVFLDNFYDAKESEELSKLVLFRTSIMLVFNGDHKKSLAQQKLLESRYFENEIGENENSYEFPEQWFVDLAKISKIIKKTAGFSLVFEHTQQTFEFFTHDFEKTVRIVEKIQSKMQEFLEKKVLVVEDEGEVFSPRSKDKSDKIVEDLLLQQFFLINVIKLSISGQVQKKMVLGFGEKSLVEISVEDKKVLNKLSYDGIREVIRHEHDYCGIELIDSNFQRRHYIVCSSNRDVSINNLMHLMRSENFLFKNDFVHSSSPNYNLMISGFLQGEVDEEYEIEMLKRISLGKNLQEVYELLKEFNVNATGYRIRSVDPKSFQLLHQIFGKILSNTIQRPEVACFLENYYSWLYYKNLIPELSLYEIENFDSAELHKEKLVVLLQEEHFLFLENDEFLNIQKMTLCSFVSLIQKIEEILKTLTILARSLVFFRDIALYKQDDFYEKSLGLIVSLNDCPSDLISYLSANLLLAIVDSGYHNDKKHELQNKFLLVKKTFFLTKLVESLACKTLFGSKNQESRFSLSLQKSLALFENIFITHKESTALEDQNLIYKVLTSKIMIAALANLGRVESFSLLYQGTRIFNHLFEISVKSSYKELQSLFLNSTCLFLLHIFHGLSNLSLHQRKLSINFISYLLMENQIGCSLVIRIIPKCLFSRVSTSESDISKWGQTHWEELFNILKQNFNTPTEQWNDACRKELLTKLKKADEDFYRKRRDITEKEIALNNGDLNIPESKLLSLKWNHEEFSIDYECLNNKFLVWKYYLSCLVRDKEGPILTIAISQPLRLWNELTYSFISSLNPLERDKILKAMILLYRYHSHHIREISSIPYWVHLLRNELFFDHQYLIIQLIYCSFNRDENTINKLNIKRLLESGMVQVLYEILSGLHFSLEDLNDKNFNYANPLHNFTEAKFIKSSVNNSKEVNTSIGLFILNMLQMLLNKQKPLDENDREVFPHPFVKSISIQELNIESLVNALLMPEPEIQKIVFQILKEHFLDKIAYKNLMSVNAFFEILLSKITQNNMKDIMGLVMSLYQRISEDPDMPNYINVYLAFDFESLDPQVVQESLEFFPFLKYFPKNLIYRLFTKGYEEFASIYFADIFEEPNLIWTKAMREKVLTLIANDLRSFQEALLKYSSSSGVHKIENLPRFKSNIAGEIFHENIEHEVKCGPLFLRVWNMKSQKHFYIEEEMINRFLVMLGENLGTLILGKTRQQFEETVFMEDLLILLHSHSKAIKRYEIHQYTSFEEVIIILHYFSDYYIDQNLSPLKSRNSQDPTFLIQIINHSLRLVYRAIRIENSGNLENFLDNKGFSAIFAALHALVQKVFMVKKVPEQIYYYNNVNLNTKDLGSLCLAVKILRYIFQKNKAEIAMQDPIQLLRLSILLQKISKIPLIYFEFLKYRKKFSAIEFHKKSPSLSATHEKEKNLFEDLTFSHEEGVVGHTENGSVFLELYEKKIFFLMSDLAFIWLNFSVDLTLLDSFIKSGALLRCLEFALLYEESFEIGSCDFERTQKINEISEDCVLVLRNVSIYANEVFLLKNTAYSGDLGVLKKIPSSTKHKSELLFNEISRLSKKKKDVLNAFFEGLCTLIMPRSLQTLLEDYYEAVEKPEEKDKRSIKKFVLLLNKDLEEESFIWTQENRDDLKDILKLQICLINEDENKSFVEKIEGYRYGNHLNELEIDGIFVKIFNKNNTKIRDHPHFLKELFYEMYARVKCLEENTVFYHKNTNNKRILKGKVFDVKRLIEALKAVNNLLRLTNGLHTIVLEKTNFSILVILLEECQKWFSEMRSFLTNLQLEIYNILENLIANTQEILKIITHTKLMKVFFKQLKSNIRNENVVIEKLLKVLWNLSLQGIYFKILGKFGFVFVLFEIVLKTEIISKSNRILALKLLLKLQEDEFENKQNFLTCIQLFPLEIQHIIKENLNVTDFIDSLDLNIETPYFIWQKEMRQEIWKIISEANEIIIKEIDSLQISHISMEDPLFLTQYVEALKKPEFPTLMNEVVIREVFLRNFNKYPNTDIKVNLAIFIEETSKKAQEIYLILAKDLTMINEKSLSKQEKKRIDRKVCEFLILITGVLLGIEQFLYNKTNPQAAFTTSSFVFMNTSEDSVLSREENKLLDHSRFLSEETMSNIIKWLDILNIPETPLTIK